MSRSVRHTPITGFTTAPSDKVTKRQAHHQQRVATRCALAADQEMPSERAFGDPCLSLKDGKQIFDPKAHPSLMRK